MKMEIDVKDIDSSNLYSIEYEFSAINGEAMLSYPSKTTGILFATFRNGSRYRYPQVSVEDVLKIFLADSVGQMFNELITKKHFNYEKL